MYVSSAGLIATSSRSVAPPPVHRPATVAAVLEALAGHATPPIPIAGGTDLCAAFNEGLHPSALVALDRVDDLRGIAVGGGALRIGALVTHDAGASHKLVEAYVPGLAAAWRQISNVRVRFWGTIGGNLMARRTRYEMSLLLHALDARLHFLSAIRGETVLTPAALWMDGPPTRALLTHVAIPLRGRVMLQYDRTLRPIATLATCADDSGTRAAMGTGLLRPVMLAVPGDMAPREAAVAAIATLPSGFADSATSHWYLRQVGEVMLRRSLERLGHAT